MTKRSLLAPFSQYGFLIGVLSFIALFSSMGIRSAFGAYVTSWEATFSVTRVEISAISFLSLLVYGLGIVFGGQLTDRFGPRIILTFSMALMGLGMLAGYFAQNVWQLMLFYGIVASLGFGGASNVTVSVAIVNWFQKKRGLIIGIVIVGMSAGSMVHVPVTIYLIKSLGWRETVLIIGSVYILLLTPLYWFGFRDRPKNATESKEKQKAVETETSPRTSIFRLPITWLIIFPYFICGFTDVGLIQTHLIPLLEDRGISAATIASSMVVYGLLNIAGAVGGGYLSDRMKPGTLISLLFGLRLIGLALLFTADSSWIVFLFCVIYALTDIATVAPFTALCTQIYGESKIGSAFGSITFFHQLGAALGSLIPGMLFQIFTGYRSTLVLCFGLLVAAIVVLKRIRRPA